MDVEPYRPSLDCSGQNLIWNDNVLGVQRGLVVTIQKLRFDPVAIASPVDVRFGPSPPTHSQFAFDAQEPRGKMVIDFVAATSDFEPARREITRFLDNHACWVAPVVGDSDEGADAAFTELTWRGDSTDCARMHPEGAGRGSLATADFIGLPPSNSDFGRREAMLRVEVPDPLEHRWHWGDDGGSQTETADSVVVELFFDPLAANNPGVFVDRSGHLRLPTVRPWRVAEFIKSKRWAEAVDIFDETTGPPPNSLHYWLQEIEFEDGRVAIETGDLRFAKAAADVFGFFPKAGAWLQFAGPPQTMILNSQPKTISIARLATTVIHERVHYAHFACSQTVQPAGINAIVAFRVSRPRWCWNEDPELLRGGFAQIFGWRDGSSPVVSDRTARDEGSTYCNPASPGPSWPRFDNRFAFAVGATEPDSILSATNVLLDLDRDSLSDATVMVPWLGFRRVTACKISREGGPCRFPSFRGSNASDRQQAQWTLCDRSDSPYPNSAPVDSPAAENPHSMPYAISQTMDLRAYADVDWSVGGGRWGSRP